MCRRTLLHLRFRLYRRLRRAERIFVLVEDDGTDLRSISNLNYDHNSMNYSVEFRKLDFKVYRRSCSGDFFDKGRHRYSRLFTCFVCDLSPADLIQKIFAEVRTNAVGTVEVGGLLEHLRHIKGQIWRQEQTSSFSGDRDAFSSLKIS